jgi:hypothetical protein
MAIMAECDTLPGYAAVADRIGMPAQAGRTFCANDHT